MSKICSNFAVENEFLTCQNRVTNSHKILILNKIIADLQQVMKITSTVGLSGFESWLSNKKEQSPFGGCSFFCLNLWARSYRALVAKNPTFRVPADFNLWGERRALA